MSLAISGSLTGVLDWPAAFKDALVTALVAGALGLFIVGFRTADFGKGLGFEYQFVDLAIACGVIFAGRFALSCARGGTSLVTLLLGAGLLAIALLAPLPSAFLRTVSGLAGVALLVAGTWTSVRGTSAGGGRIAALSAASDVLGTRVFPWFGAALLGVAVVLPFMPFADQKVMDLGILILTYVMLGWGLNIVVGLAGLLDLGYVAFYAVGAYAYAMLSTQHGWSFWMCLPVAGMLAATFGVVLGFPVLRLRGDYLAIVTLGFGEIIRIVLLNWTDFTQGPAGIGGIPSATLFGRVFAENAPAGGRPSTSGWRFRSPPITG